MRPPPRALVLSAGIGERLRPITLDRPKTMVAVGGFPVLEYHVVLLRELGIREIAINLHHCPEVVTAHFGDGSRWGVSIRYSREERLLGTAGAAKRLEGFLGGGTFLVVYGDQLFDYDLGPFLERHAERRAAATLGVIEGTEPTAGGIVAMGSDGRVTRFLEKPAPNQVFSTLVSAGIYAMEPQVLEAIPADAPSDFGRDILPGLIRSGLAIYAERLEGTLLSIDTLERYRATEEAVRSGALDRHPLRIGLGRARCR